MSILKTDVILPNASDKLQIGFIEEPIRPGHPSTKYYADLRIRGTFNFRGFWNDLSGPTYPVDPANRDMYVIDAVSVLEGDSFLPGDWIIFDDGEWIHISNGSFIAGAMITTMPPLRNVAGVLGMEVASETEDGCISTTQQTFAGVKTFTVLPTIPQTPLLPTDAASKGYVDLQISTGGADAPTYHITYNTGTGVMTMAPATASSTSHQVIITGAVGDDSVVTSGGVSFEKNVYSTDGMTIVGPDSSTTHIATDGSGNMVITASAVVCSNRVSVAAPVVGDDVVTKGWVDGQTATIYPAVISSITSSIDKTVSFRCGSLTYLWDMSFAKAGDFAVAKFPYLSFTPILIEAQPPVEVVEGDFLGNIQIGLNTLFTFIWAVLPADPDTQFTCFAPAGSIPAAYVPTEVVSDMILINNDWGLIQYRTDGGITIVRSRSNPYFIKDKLYVMNGKYTSWSL